MMSAGREESKPLLALEKGETSDDTTENVEENQKTKLQRALKWGPLILILLSLIGVYMEYPWIASKYAGEYDLKYTIESIGNIQNDKLDATIKIENLPNSYWPIRLGFEDVVTLYKGREFAECKVPFVWIDNVSKRGKSVKIQIKIIEPAIMAEIIKNGLLQTKQSVQVRLKVRAKPKYFFSLLPVSVQKMIELPIKAEIPLLTDDLFDLVDILGADEKTITAQVKLPPTPLHTKIDVVHGAVTVMMEKEPIAKISIKGNLINLCRENRLPVYIEPVVGEAFSRFLSEALKGDLVYTSFLISKEDSHPFLAQFSEHLKDVVVPIRMQAMSTIEEIQLIRVKGRWTPVGAAIVTNPFTAPLTLLSLTNCKVFKSEKLFASIEEPNIDPPVVIPGKAEHFKVDQSMTGKFEGSLMDILRTIRELLSGERTAYVDVEGVLTVMLDRFKVIITNSQRKVPIRVHTEKDKIDN